MLGKLQPRERASPPAAQHLQLGPITPLPPGLARRLELLLLLGGLLLLPFGFGSQELLSSILQAQLAQHLPVALDASLPLELKLRQALLLLVLHAAGCFAVCWDGKRRDRCISCV